MQYYDGAHQYQPWNPLLKCAKCGEPSGDLWICVECSELAAALNEIRDNVGRVE